MLNIKAATLIATMSRVLKETTRRREETPVLDLQDLLEGVDTELVDRIWADELTEEDYEQLRKYLAEKYGIVMQPPLPRGWTDKIKEVVKSMGILRSTNEKTTTTNEPRHVSDYLYYLEDRDLLTGLMSWERFKQLLSYMPITVVTTRYTEKGLDGTVLDYGPRLLDIITIAARCPGTYLAPLIHGKNSPEEKVEIKAIALPEECRREYEYLINHSVDTDMDYGEIILNGRGYLAIVW